MILMLQFKVFLLSFFQSLSHVWLFATPWTTACQASLSFTVSWSLLKLMFFELVMISNHVIIGHPTSPLPSIFPSIRVFFNESPLCVGCQCIAASASNLLMNIQAWFPSGLTGLISLLSKGLSRVFSSTTVWKHQFCGTQPSLWSNSHIQAWVPEKNHSLDYTLVGIGWYRLVDYTLDIGWHGDVFTF